MSPVHYQQHPLPHVVLAQLSVLQCTTAIEAVKHSGLMAIFAEFDVGVYILVVFLPFLGTKGLEAPAVYKLQPMDRVEIYRPLIADPKEVRRRRAAEAAAKAADKQEKPD